MNPDPVSRRRLLLGAGAWTAFASANAAAVVDGPARLRAGATKSTLLDLTLAGSRLIAVGERGHVLLSDDQGKSWRQARSVPTRTTLTALHATDEQRLWAAGHGGVILHSADAGETWNLTTGRADGPDVLLAIRVEADGRGLAIGGFGFARATADGGKTWQPLTLLEGEAGEKHLNRIFVSAAGTWLIAAEGGQVLRSSDRGTVQAMKWSPIKTPYAGSLWHGMQLAGGALLACGMRGNVVRSVDDGRTWTHQSIAGAGSLTGIAQLGDGRVVLVGLDGTLVVGDAAAEKFSLLRQDDRTTLTAALALRDGTMLLATAAGLRVIAAPNPAR